MQGHSVVDWGYVGAFRDMQGIVDARRDILGPARVIYNHYWHNCTRRHQHSDTWNNSYAFRMAAKYESPTCSRIPLSQASRVALPRNAHSVLGPAKPDPAETRSRLQGTRKKSPSNSPSHQISPSRPTSKIRPPPMLRAPR